VLFSPFSASNQRGRSKEEMEVEEKEQESELDMASVSSFMQANLQHSFAASKFISRAVSVKGMYMTLIQEQWYQGSRFKKLNIPGYTLFSAGGTDRPRARRTRRLVCCQDSLAGT